jgi:hypothetical protein
MIVYYPLTEIRDVHEDWRAFKCHRIGYLFFRKKDPFVFGGKELFKPRCLLCEDAETALKNWVTRRDPERHYLFYSPSRHNISYVAT